MASVVNQFLFLSLLISWMSVYNVDGNCELKQRAHGINPMTLGLLYCKDTTFSVPLDSSKAIELMNAEDTYKYKVTDLRSKVEYFFDRILLVNDKAVGTDYPFLSNSEMVMLVVHRRAAPKGTDTRYLIIGVNLEEGKSMKADNDGIVSAGLNVLAGAISRKNATARFKLSSLFPASGRINRHSKNDSNCVNTYIYIQLQDSLKLSTKQYSDLKTISTSDWSTGKTDLPTGAPSLTETDQQVRFDCQRATDPNAGTSRGGKLKCYAQFWGVQFLLLTVLQIWNQWN